MPAGILYPFARITASMCSRSEPRCGFLIFLANPGVDIKVEATNRRVSRRIILVMQVWLAWEIALELHPIEALHALLSVGLDERVQFAIGDIVQILSVGPDVAHRFR
jgi:hypothetical protein